jgi:hypothetical protein
MLTRLLALLFLSDFWAFDIWKIGAMTDFVCALILRFFAGGFFGETESCFNAFDNSSSLVSGVGVAGRGCNNETGRGEVEGRARSAGKFLEK